MLRHSRVRLLHVFPRAVFIALAFAVSAFAATPASFRGKVVETPNGDKTGMIFVMGRNGAMRKVSVSSAKVIYSNEVPVGKRHKQPSLSLKHGTEVRVVAEDNGSGTWLAHSVEILSLPGASAAAKPAPRKPHKPDAPDVPVAAPTLSRRS